MLPAAIVLRFDPNLEVAGRILRWETLALALAMLLGLILAAWLAGRANRPEPSAPDRPNRPEPSAAGPPEPSTAGPHEPSAAEPRLRRDDLLLIVIGALPGAVIGGRILHAVDFAAFYATDPFALLDPARGSLSLLGAVLGGLVTGGYVGWLLEAPLGRWLDVAIGPLLLVIGLGKLANVLGGAGQGAPTDLPWALAFAGDGPWRSLAPGVPAHPSQVYEGLWVLAGLGLGVLFARWAKARRTRRGAVRMRPTGSLFLLGLAWWALGRVVVGFSWRDATALGPLGTEQLAALAVLLGSSALLGRAVWGRRRVRGEPVTGGAAAVD